MQAKGDIIDHNKTTTPTIDPISKVPDVTTRRSQPGRATVNMPADGLLVEVVPDLAVEAAVVPGLVLVADGVVLGRMLDPVMTAPLRIVEVVEQEDELGIG